MDKQKDIQALDDEALDQVSGGIEFNLLINRDKKNQKRTSRNDLLYRGEQVKAGGLVWHSGTTNGLTANNLTVQGTGTQEDEDNVLIPM